MKTKQTLLVAILSTSLILVTGCSGDVNLPREFTVTFDTNGAQTIESQKVKEGYVITGVTVPTHSNSNVIFDGWFTEDPLTKEYVEFDIENHRVFDNITLKAEWTYPSESPQNIKLADDAFTRTITWIQQGITSADDIKVQARIGKLDYKYTYDENYDKRVISGTKVEYGDTLVDVAGTLNIIDEYHLSYTLDNPTTDYYQFVISSANGETIFTPGESEGDIRFKGDGSKEKPYLVYNETDLKYLTTHNFDKFTYAEIKNDITLMSIYSDKSNCTFDGHLTATKSNELIKTSENYTITLKNDSGLFHILGENAEIENVTLNGSLYGANPSMGVLANYNYGTIKKVNSKAVSINSRGGKVNDFSTLNQGGSGGIVGTNHGLITDCQVSSVRDNVIQGHIGVGGIAGINYGTITEMTVDAIVGAYNGNEISLTINNSYAGAVVGVNFGTVSYIDVYNGKVNCRRLDDGKEGEGASNIGGVVGYNATSGKISNCLFDGMRCVGDTNVGGIAGYNDGIIESCYTGRRLRKPSNTILTERQFISPVIGSYNVGGICGKVGPNSNINHVFSTANVWAYKTRAYSVAEKADYAVYINCNQNLRNSSTWLGQKYGVVLSDDLVAPDGRKATEVDNKPMQGLTMNNALGYRFNENGKYVYNKELVMMYLDVLGDDFGFRESASHGIRLLFENSVKPKSELNLK